MGRAEFAWIGFYEKFADKLLDFRDRPRDLLDLVRPLADKYPLMRYLHLEKDEYWQKRGNAIDPFTVSGIFNRAVSDAHRRQLGDALANALGLACAAPASYRGIPYLDARHSIYEGEREIWRLFNAATANDADPAKNEFCDAWDAARAVKGNALGTLSMALYWARPNAFMPVDSVSAPFIRSELGMDVPEDKCAGREYAGFLAALEGRLAKGGIAESFPALALAAAEKAGKNA